jgi:subtilisin family serine protease
MEHETKLPKYEINEQLGSLSQRIDWGLRQLNVPKTWSITRGGGITVMVIDTGHPVHPDIGDNAIEGKNCISGEPIEDENGHQLHCTGIICAKDNQTGMVGVAPEAKCISVKALNKSGSGSYYGLAEALDYAIEVKPDLVSMSLGGPTPSPVLQERIKTLYELNIPVICAAGNSGDGGVNYPAAFDETIAVAAYDKYGKVARFSSKGEKVEWAAPGVNIYSTFLNDGYASLSGTSMACPFIAGVVALMLAKHKKQEEATGMNDCKTVAQIREHLLKYTNDKGAVGRDNSWGYGVIDVEKLIGGDDEEPPSEEPADEEPPSEEPPVEEPVEEEPPVEEPWKKNHLSKNLWKKNHLLKNLWKKNHLLKNHLLKNLWKKNHPLKNLKRKRKILCLLFLGSWSLLLSLELR